MLYTLLMIALLAFGFGFVIFFHELGHFLAAKWVGIRVEQFAVGFGHAVLCWRKGIGVRVGTTRPEYERRARAHLPAMEGSALTDDLARAESDEERIEIAAQDLGLGETEYRLNWIPLGGYVKMLGQDDLRPGVEVAHPKSYNSKTVGQRMVVVSAGVIMNIILAAIGFTFLFLTMGFNAPPAMVGNVVPGSPAAEANLNVGDRILEFEGRRQHDFTKISLNSALAEEGVAVPLRIRRVDGTEETVMVSPRRPTTDSRGFLMLGIGHPLELRGVQERDFFAGDSPEELFLAESLAIRPGEVITHVAGEPVGVQEYWKLHRALQLSDGQPVAVTVADAEGRSRQEWVRPELQGSFSAREPLHFAGMEPRASVRMLRPNSAARGLLLPGDVILEVSMSGPPHNRRENPPSGELVRWVVERGSERAAIDITVLRDGEIMTIEGLVPNVRLGGGRYGLGFEPGYDQYNPVVANVLDGSPAAEAGIPVGTRITAINGEPVESWFDVHRLLSQATPQQPVAVAASGGDGSERVYELTLSESQVEWLASYQYIHSLRLHSHTEPRKTNNPLIAAWWGVTETRDFVLQFYLTLQRMFQGSVSYTNMMGPVGIFHAGYTFADRGPDWLIWFLAMISANLAVVNFLPIPIVDGGLFTFLILEKIKGKPVSETTQKLAQVVGLAILLSVFLLVTYQDIARFF